MRAWNDGSGLITHGAERAPDGTAVSCRRDWAGKSLGDQSDFPRVYGVDGVVLGTVVRGVQHTSGLHSAEQCGHHDDNMVMTDSSSEMRTAEPAACLFRPRHRSG